MTLGDRDVMARACFASCRAIGLFIRSARYSRVRLVIKDGELRVQKWRVFYAPPLIWLGDWLMSALNTGIRVLPRRDWEARERHVYAGVYGKSVAILADGVLLLPVLAGKTLAALLEDPQISEALRKQAIEAAAAALAALHRLGVTHADAMADNVLVDSDGAAARWFDFETVHVSTRPTVWRRADDVRALLVTCLVRTAPEKHGEVVDCIFDCYADEEVLRAVASSFVSVWRRALPFHLAQAGLSFDSFRATAALMENRSSTEDACREIGFEPGCC